MYVNLRAYGGSLDFVSTQVSSVSVAGGGKEFACHTL